MSDNDLFPACIPHAEMEIHAVDTDTIDTDAIDIVFFNCTCLELHF